MKLSLFVFFLAICSTGLMAGVFFTWSNAVKPGLGLLEDIIYLTAFQSMNRVILNPSFYLLFALPILSLWASTFLMYSSLSKPIFMLILVASVIYSVGAFGVTVAGNIPLNEQLDAVNLSKISAQEAQQLRQLIEVKWNVFNWIRTVSSTVAFVLVLLVLFLHDFR